MSKLLSALGMAAVLGLASVAGQANANIPFSGTGSSGDLSSPGAESWNFNYDGGTLENDWGSPGVGAGIDVYNESQVAYGFDVTFSGGGTIDTSSIATGNAAGCVGSTYGGTTFCVYGSSDIWEAFQTGPDTIQFLAQDSSFNLGNPSSGANNDEYFVNVFFTGATPTSFSGQWLTSYSPTPSAAPEPGTWVLMFGGIGLIGSMLRMTQARRRGLQMTSVALV